MGLFKARRAISACALSTAALAAVVVPSGASAATQCSGSNILGAGSSAQKLAQKEVWDSEAAVKGLGFNVSKNADACSGTQGSLGKPEVKYESIGSGAGLEKWGVNGHAFEGAAVAFVGTDEPVNTTQKEEIEKNETVKTPSTVQSIPVLQFAVAIPVHLPEGCTVTSKTNPGRLVLGNETLQKIFRGEISKWTEITDGSDKFTGATCETEITRVVRLDQSGTSHVFKKYLGTINNVAFETEKNESKTWNEVAEGTENTTWPAAAKVVKPAKTGGGAVVAEVAAKPSSIGYAALNDVRNNGSFSKTGVGGPGTTKFWAPVQNNGTITGTKETFKDPATNGDVEALANSNCAKEKYVNKAGELFPPANTSLPFNEVTTGPKQVNYPICGLTYDMAFSSYSAYGLPAGEAQGTADYLQYVVDTLAEGGQLQVVGHDYEKLPASLNDLAQDGVDLIKA